MKSVMVMCIFMLLSACSSDDKTPAEKLEAAGREQGQKMAEELKKPIDKAKEVEQLTLDAAKAQQDAINNQIDTESNPDAEPKVDPQSDPQ